MFHFLRPTATGRIEFSARFAELVDARGTRLGINRKQLVHPLHQARSISPCGYRRGFRCTSWAVLSQKSPGALEWGSPHETEFKVR